MVLSVYSAEGMKWSLLFLLRFGGRKNLTFCVGPGLFVKKTLEPFPWGGGDTYDLFLGDGVIYEVYYKYDERAEIAFNH